MGNKSGAPSGTGSHAGTEPEDGLGPPGFDPSRWSKGRQRWLNPYHWPCPACGAVEPTPEGHDPCIADLPGVDFACCGHGCQAGYIAFANGTVIRGEFEQFYGLRNPSDAVARRSCDSARRQMTPRTGLEDARDEDH